MVLSLAVSAQALDKAELDGRIRNLANKFEAMQAKPDKRIPAETLRRAQGLILLDRTKAGFVFAFQGGGGVAMVKDPATRAWSAPAFVSANEASLGLQIGGQQSFMVILLMNTNAARKLTEGSFDFGGEASGTAGNSTGGVEGSISSNEQLAIVYGDSTGLYGGVAIKGGSLTPDSNADIVYYGQYLTASEILFGHAVKPSDTAAQLARKIEHFSK